MLYITVKQTKRSYIPGTLASLYITVIHFVRSYQNTCVSLVMYKITEMRLDYIIYIDKIKKNKNK